MVFQENLHLCQNEPTCNISYYCKAKNFLSFELLLEALSSLTLRREKSKKCLTKKLSPNFPPLQMQVKLVKDGQFSINMTFGCISTKNHQIWTKQKSFDRS